MGSAGNLGKLGRDFTAPSRYKQGLIEAAFVDVVEKVGPVPRTYVTDQVEEGLIRIPRVWTGNPRPRDLKTKIHPSGYMGNGEILQGRSRNTFPSTKYARRRK